MIAVFGFLLAAFNTYWIHLRWSENASMTILDFGVRDPQPTNAYWIVESVLLNSGNKQCTVTDCTLIFSHGTNTDTHLYWPWDRKEALLLPTQEMRALQMRYGQRIYNEFHDRWPKGEKINAQLEVLLVDSKGETHKVVAPLGTVAWSQGLAFESGGFPKTIPLLPSATHTDPFPLSRRNE
ncbi:MAG: hypothetical protein WC299_13990 [Kiritimatiellia bacterium]